MLVHSLLLCLSLFLSPRPPQLAQSPGSLESQPLQIEAPPELTALRMRLEALPHNSFSDITQFLGVSEPQSAIRVVLAPESSELARNVSPWVSGFAVGESSLIVLFPARSPGYPDQTLEDVLRHEVAHVLISRAAGRSVAMARVPGRSGDIARAAGRCSRRASRRSRRRRPSRPRRSASSSTRSSASKGRR